MGLLDEAFERTTGSLSGGQPAEIPRHTHTFFVPPKTCAPGVFADEDGNEVGFWLTLRSLSPAQEMAIINRSMPGGRQKKVRADSATELVQAAIHLFHEHLPVTLGGADDGVTLPRGKKEWLWQVLTQRGRNLVAQEYDALTEPVGLDSEGNG
jgi:hypothetical protein